MTVAEATGAMAWNTVRAAQPRPGIWVLTLNRPEAMNAMNVELVGDLHAALDTLGADVDCRVIILTGAGRAFCAGLDLKGYGIVPGNEKSRGPGRRLAGQQHISSLVGRLRHLRQPVIAAVNGAAMGGGLGLALACDLRCASAGARFGVTFTRVGLSGCDFGVAYLLPRIIGAARAWELMLTGRAVDAEAARDLGLVGQLTPDGDVVPAAIELAEEIAANSPFGIWMTKEVMWDALEAGSLQTVIDLENRTQILATYGDEHAEARRAFVERRPPDFKRSAP